MIAAASSAASAQDRLPPVLRAQSARSTSWSEKHT